MPTLAVKDLHFAYPSKIGTPYDVLKGISLEFDARPTAIIGQNGSGKTTFVKLLKGLLTPSCGEIIFNGKNINTVTVATLAKDIGLIFQNPNDQIFKNTVLDEVMFGPLQIGMSYDEARISSENALNTVKLLEYKKDNPYDLGLSDRKLVSIASIIAMNTDVIIFDEPTIAQDYSGKELIKNIMLDLKSKGKLVISILHDMDFVAETFERVIVFANGNVLLDGTPLEVFSKRDVLEQAYLEQPNVTKLCHSLNYKEIFLNVEDFVNFVKH